MSDKPKPAVACNWTDCGCPRFLEDDRPSVDDETPAWARELAARIDEVARNANRSAPS